MGDEEAGLPPPIEREDDVQGWLEFEADDYDFDAKLPPLFTSEQITRKTMQDLEDEKRAVERAADADERIGFLLEFVRAEEATDGLATYGGAVYPRPKPTIFNVCTT